MKDLKHKVALITGGSRGIGAAIAKRLALDGASVAITYKSSADNAGKVVQEIHHQGGKAFAIHADGGDPEAVIRAVEQTATKFGGLDILVNNAGIGLYKDINEFTLQDFDQIMAVNVRAVFAGSTAALQYLKTGGRIITIGSCQAERMPGPGGSLYAMSKSALVGLTKGMARDLGSKGITVNLVNPGPVNTEMNPSDGPFADYQRSLMAVPEFGSVEDIAALVSYLAGPQSGFVTGSELTIDGGTNI